MPQNSFEGKSKKGNIQDALSAAIENAKGTLHTDFVIWKLGSISGSDGGIAQTHDLTVSIEAEPFKNK
jgi:hypothetical protein